MMKSMLNVEKTGAQNWVQFKNNPNLHEHQLNREKNPIKTGSETKKKKNGFRERKEKKKREGMVP
jgi:hypothetical protein